VLGADGDSRLPIPATRKAEGIHHPARNLDNNARWAFNLEKSANHAPLCPPHPDLQAEIGVPTVMNFPLLADMGRMNGQWLWAGSRSFFARSERGGQRAAFMYSLIWTEKLNDVDPQAWLADVIARISDITVPRLPELLPWAWKNAVPQVKAA